jgi:hypothetical protein
MITYPGARDDHLKENPADFETDRNFAQYLPQRSMTQR